MGASVDKKWFFDRWGEKGLSLRKVAKLMELDPSALSRTLNSEREMKIAEVGKMAKILDLSQAEVLTRIEGSVARPPASAAETVRISDHPGFGFMNGLIKFEEGFDGTGPFDDEPWDNGYLGEDRR